MLAVSPVQQHEQEAERRRKIRRSALWLALLAAAFYFGFIAMSILRGS
ncbi:MAG TPA: hypothetical protein VF193_03025 [Steroidobacter sp.]